MKRVLYLVRDPREVCVSYYHHMIRSRGESYDIALPEFVDLFVGGGVGSYGSWGEHVGSWLGARRDCSNFCVMRYEDLKLLPCEELFASLQPLFPSLSFDGLSRARDLSSFKNMKRLEGVAGERWKIKGLDRGTGDFVRSGKTESWRDVLSPVDVAKIEKAFSGVMSECGYKLEFFNGQGGGGV